MDRLLMLFMLPPVLRGGAALFISGAFFPLCGVMLLRLQLVPLRYMLMHGVILGGALAVALSLPLVPLTVMVNLALVFAMTYFSKNESFSFGGVSAASMVFSMALASLITRTFPQKTLSVCCGGVPLHSVGRISCFLPCSRFFSPHILLLILKILQLSFSAEISHIHSVYAYVLTIRSWYRLSHSP